MTMPPPLPGNATPSPAVAKPPQYAAAPGKPMCTAAVVSLVASFIAWVILPVIGSIVGIVAGHMARGEIRRSNGELDGDILAIIGLVLGYLQLVMLLLLVVGIVIFFGGLAAIIAAAN